MSDIIANLGDLSGKAGEFLKINSSETQLETGSVVFGSEFEKFESMTESSSATSYIDKIDATTSSKPAGTYRIGFSCEVTGDYQEITFNVDGSAIHDHTTGNDELEPKVSSNSNWTTLSGIYYKTLSSASTIDLNIQHKDSGSGKMSNAVIEIWRVA